MSCDTITVNTPLTLPNLNPLQVFGKAVKLYKAGYACRLIICEKILIFLNYGGTQTPRVSTYMHGSTQFKHSRRHQSRARNRFKSPSRTSYRGSRNRDLIGIHKRKKNFILYQVNWAEYCTWLCGVIASFYCLQKPHIWNKLRSDTSFDIKSK